MLCKRRLRLHGKAKKETSQASRLQKGRTLWFSLHISQDRAGRVRPLLLGCVCRTLKNSWSFEVCQPESETRDRQGQQGSRTCLMPRWREYVLRVREPSQPIPGYDEYLVCSLSSRLLAAHGMHKCCIGPASNSELLVRSKRVGGIFSTSSHILSTASPDLRHG